MFRKHYNISPFDTKNSARKKMRDYRRGYLLYKKNDKIYIFRKLKGELNQKIIKFNILFLNLLFTFFPVLKKVNFNLVISQYIFQKSRVKRIYLDMLLYTLNKKKIFQPLCSDYVNILRKNNYQVSSLSNLILWPLFCILFWCYGNYLYFLIIIKSFLNLFIQQKKPDLYFFSITKDNLPTENQSIKSRKSYDLISWFRSFYANDLGNNIIISHDNANLKNRDIDEMNIVHTDQPWFYLNSIANIFYFSIVGIIFSFISIILIFFNKTSPGLLFSEILKSISVILSDKKKISKKYLFHYSETYYRPLWTYLLDHKNIICYFYSAYDSPTNNKTEEIGHYYEFGNITWPTVLVWDEVQSKKISKYVRKDIVDANLIKTGPIWFTDTNYIFKSDKKKILMFDLTVHRISVHYGFYDTAEYVDKIDDFNCLFLNDIFSTFKSTQYEIILKRKRPNMYIKTNYRNLVKKLTKEGLTVIDEPVSAYYLTKKSEIVFSTPFTSANLMTNNYKNNFYYDPIKKVLKNDIAARGLPIISGLDELKKLKEQII